MEDPLFNAKYTVWIYFPFAKVNPYQPDNAIMRYVLSCNMWFSCFIILLKAKRREIIQNCKMQGFFLRIASSRYKVHVINQISQLEKVERYQPCNAKVKKILRLWIVVQKVVLRFYNASQRQKNIMLLCIVVLNVVLKFYHAPQGKEETTF